MNRHHEGISLGLEVDVTIITRWITFISAVVIGYSLLWLFWKINKLNEKAKETDTTISITALRVSFWMAIGGIVIIILGLFCLMGILPWWT